MILHNEQDAIKQAVAVTFGYDFDGFVSEDTFPYGYCDIRVIGSEVQLRRVRKDGHSGRWVYCGRLQEVLQDPAFWQALGKARGWGLLCDVCEVRVTSDTDQAHEWYDCRGVAKEEWDIYSDKWFQSNKKSLMSGGDMQKFWESLS